MTSSWQSPSILKSVSGHFPPQSSRGFGGQTLGRWLTYDDMKRSSEEFLRLREAGEKSIFWGSNKSYVVWTDYHAQYAEHPNGSPLQRDRVKEMDGSELVSH